MTRTEQLAEEIKKIAKKESEEIASLSFHGPRGGSNAKNIPGWIAPGISTLTIACKLAGVPTMNYWHGGPGTPSQAIPDCIYADAMTAYRKIFRK